MSKYKKRLYVIRGFNPFADEKTFNCLGEMKNLPNFKEFVGDDIQSNTILNMMKMPFENMASSAVHVFSEICKVGKFSPNSILNLSDKALNLSVNEIDRKSVV